MIVTMIDINQYIDTLLTLNKLVIVMTVSSITSYYCFDVLKKLRKI